MSVQLPLGMVLSSQVLINSWIDFPGIFNLIIQDIKMTRFLKLSDNFWSLHRHYSMNGITVVCAEMRIVIS